MDSSSRARRANPDEAEVVTRNRAIHYESQHRKVRGLVNVAYRGLSLPQSAGRILGAMPKVTTVGAGSAIFARQVMTDVLAVDGIDRDVLAAFE